MIVEHYFAPSQQQQHHLPTKRRKRRREKKLVYHPELGYNACSLRIFVAPRQVAALTIIRAAIGEKGKSRNERLITGLESRAASGNSYFDPQFIQLGLLVEFSNNRRNHSRP